MELKEKIELLKMDQPKIVRVLVSVMVIENWGIKGKEKVIMNIPCSNLADAYLTSIKTNNDFEKKGYRFLDESNDSLIGSTRSVINIDQYFDLTDATGGCRLCAEECFFKKDK
jgi:hypothetical protein